MRIDFPFDRPDGRAVYRSFVERAAELVGGYGGSMSGEHGDGRARSELLPRMFEPAAIEAMAAVKAVFDPRDLLNPGVLVRPRPLDADLRRPMARPVTEGLGFRYPEDGGDLTSAVHRCTGIGRCVADNTGAGGVMCPSWLATRDEKDTTRGRSRVLQEAVNGTLVGGLSAPEVHEALDLCLACKGCASDCPAEVDMATYKAEVLHQTYRGRLRPAAHYSLGWLPAGRPSPPGPRLANRLLTTPGWPPPADRLAGLDPRRPPSRRSPPRPSAPGGAAARLAAAGPAPGCCCGPTPSPTTSPPERARPPSGSWRPPATGSTSPTSPSAAASP